MTARIGWGEANLAAKYLNIIKILLSDTLDQTNEIFILSLVDIISKAIADISEIVQHKIRNIDRIPITNSDINLINNLCVASALLCNQISSLKFYEEE